MTDHQIEELLSKVLEAEPELKNRGWHPQDQMYYDVNHSFQYTLCELLHGHHEILAKFPIRQEGKKEVQSGTYIQTIIFLEETRNGTVVRFGLPRIFSYANPLSRVLQHPGRRANPFLHLYEAMWMLSGSNDVTQLTPFAKQMAEYSDDGKTMHGAYGHRWRTHFGGDQLATIIDELKQNPSSRRLVLQMWDSQADLIGFEYDANISLEVPGDQPRKMTYGVEFSKDLPCNTHCYFQTRLVETTTGIIETHLDLTVMNRSNDIIWGMLGSNYVTFSFLLEYVAQMTGLRVGRYHHFTANAHIYIDKYPRDILEEWHDHDDDHPVLFLPLDEMVPLVTAPENFDQEVKLFVKDPYSSRYYDNQFFNQVAVPMMAAHKHFKDKELSLSLHQADLIGQADWAAAAKMFISTSKLAKQATSFLNN